MPATYRGHINALGNWADNKAAFFGVALARARETLELNVHHREALANPPEAFIEPVVGAHVGGGVPADVWLKPELKAHIAELLAAYNP